MRLNNISWNVLHHWADNLINAIYFYKTLAWEHLSLIDLSSDACAYCKKYRGKNCYGCPISTITHNPQCKDTPYMIVFACVEQIRQDRNKNLKENAFQLVKAIWEEYLFLKQTYKKKVYKW